MKHELMDGTTMAGTKSKKKKKGHRDRHVLIQILYFA